MAKFNIGLILHFQSFYLDLVNPNIPQILINREPLHHHKFDIEFFGNCDDVISELCNQLGGEWTSVTQSFKQSPIEKHILQKMFADAKAMFESGGDSSNDSNDIPENLQVLPNEVNGLPNGFSNNKTPNSLVGNNPDDSIQDDLKDISDRAISSDLEYANSGNDEVQVSSPSSDKSLKRRKKTSEERELTKRIRNQSISEKEENKGMYPIGKTFRIEDKIKCFKCLKPSTKSLFSYC